MNNTIPTKSLGDKTRSIYRTIVPNKNNAMLKLKIMLSLIFGIQLIGYSQWEEKSISTNSTLTCVDFVTENNGYVTGSNKVYKTSNGGDDWTISFMANESVFYEDIFAIDSMTVIAVGKDLSSNQAKISRTENGGTDWNDAKISNSSFLKSVFFVTSNIGFCSGGSGAILKSTDSGKSWQELNSGTGINLQSIFFVNEMVGIAVGGDPLSALILKTLDGGTSWNHIISPSNNNLQSVYFSNQETGYVAGWNGEIMKTNNCGSDWMVQNSVEMTGNLEVIFTDDNTGYIVGGTMNESLIQKTSNGGNLWEDISPQISGGLVCIQFPSFNVGYAVGINGTVVKTASGGIMTHTNNFELTHEFMVFPNPTNGSLKIGSENNTHIDKIKIYDSNGLEIESSKTISNNTEIDLSNLESDIYYLEIQSEKKREIKKIIKK